MRLAGVQGEEGPGNRAPRKVDVSPLHSELSHPRSLEAGWVLSSMPGSSQQALVSGASPPPVFAELSRPGSERSAWQGYSWSLSRPSDSPFDR